MIEAEQGVTEVAELKGSRMSERVMSIEEQNILRFADIVEKDGSLVLLGTNADVILAEDEIKKYYINELFVLRDRRLVMGDPVEFPKIEVKEVMEKCTTEERCMHAIGVLKGEENAVRLFGITRIVGYYSRVNSWNKSKVGELRDRGQGGYKLNGGKTSSEGRETAINNLSVS